MKITVNKEINYDIQKRRLPELMIEKAGHLLHAQNIQFEIDRIRKLNQTKEQ